MLATRMLGAALAALAALHAQDPASGKAPDDERVLKAWSYLLPEEQAEAVEWFRLEASVLDTFQLGCLRHVLEQADRDAGFWPELGETPYFDPKTHAPAQPIRRKRLKPDHKEALRIQKTVDKTRLPRRMISAWAYDWTTGEPRRIPHENENERIFQNALHGFAPDSDLAEVLILSILDYG